MIIAPDIDNIESKGGLNDMITNLIQMAANTGEYGEKKPIPIFFVMNRWNLGKTILRKAPVACIAILNYQGSDANFGLMMDMLPRLKDEYQEKLKNAIQMLQPEPSHDCNRDYVYNNEFKEHSSDTKPCDTLYGDIVTYSNQTKSIHESMIKILSDR